LKSLILKKINKLMAIIKLKPLTNGQRHQSLMRTKAPTTNKPEKSLTVGLKAKAGRNNTGKLTVRHHGGGVKRLYRDIDFKRNKLDIPAVVKSIEYDPNRSANIALLVYADGEKSYILAPEALEVGDKVITASKRAPFKPGNTMQLKYIPLNMPIHNVELRPGKGGQIIRSAGSMGMVLAREGNYANLQLPSGEVRKVLVTCKATLGQVSNPDWQNISWGKAGRKRRLGIRPTVRGTAQHPGSHPHGGGEGRSPVGMKHPKTPWGKIARGQITRARKKHSNKFIVKSRRK
jgi:large subunit ribosomal protein L2